MAAMDDVRGKLDPLIRAAGIATVARLFGLQRSNLSAWLAGQPKISDSNVQKIAKHFGYQVVTKIEKIR